MGIKLQSLNKFEKILMKHGKVLTLKPKGDSTDLYFIQKGHNVEHIKVSSSVDKEEEEVYEEIVKDKVIKIMNGLKEKKERFIGVWALDTLLHLDRLDIYYVLNKIYQVLVEKGLVYLSFRRGEDDVFENGEWQTCFTQNEVTDLVSFTDFSIVEVENDDEYINIILKK
ncbi:MAG: hypothetical protein ACRC5F_01670 [Cetobacterium sp.]